MLTYNSTTFCVSRRSSSYGTRWTQNEGYVSTQDQEGLHTSYFRERFRKFFMSSFPRRQNGHSDPLFPVSGKFFLSSPLSGRLHSNVTHSRADPRRRLTNVSGFIPWVNTQDVLLYRTTNTHWDSGEDSRRTRVSFKLDKRTWKPRNYT